MKKAISMGLSLVLSLSICFQSITTYAYDDLANIEDTTSEQQNVENISGGGVRRV